MSVQPKVIPEESELQQIFSQVADKQRTVFFAGLPAVGKSLYLQQFAIMAQQAGRKVHLLQWDVARPAFEIAPYQERYPEVDGITHAAVRKAVGLWARQGVWQWHCNYAGPEHILIGELPLVGNRLMELVQVHDDDAEALLAGSETKVFLPVPTRQVRAHIEQARGRSIARPRQSREAYDAPPNVVTATWQGIYDLGVELGFAKPEQQPDYNPDVYTRVYQYLLQHRQQQTLAITEVLPVTDSVYTLDGIHSELAATAEQVAQLFSQLERQFTAEQIERSVASWYQL